MTLQEELDKISESTAASAPKEALAVMHRATEELKHSGILDRTVKVGDKAPDFTLNNADGKPVHLSELTASGPVVINFFRGKW